MSFLQSVERWREEKDAFFRSGHDSPIPEHDKMNFQGLKYFPPDENYRIQASLERYEKPEMVSMITSKGTQQRFYRIGYFEFEIGGKKLRLHGYASVEGRDDHIFLPFRDGTSGKESYGAARYIDLDLSPTDDYTIDFNFAYNPYCAYSESYVCPLPPVENRLIVPIRAGEAKYHD